MLVSAVEEYESKTIYIGLPSLIEAIKFRMEQFGLYSEDLISCIGSEKEVSEVLEGKRQITPSIALALQERLGIPSEILLDKPSICSINQALASHEVYSLYDCWHSAELHPQHHGGHPPLQRLTYLHRQVRTAVVPDRSHEGHAQQPAQAEVHHR